MGVQSNNGLLVQVDFEVYGHVQGKTNFFVLLFCIIKVEIMILYANKLKVLEK